MNYLEFKHLRMICALAETGNMTKAAKKLFITQSALSQQLKDIETKLGIDLFFRTRKKMILTPTGKKLLKTAEPIVQALEDTELEIAKIVSGDKGVLKVGTQCIFCYKWLPRVVSIFQKKFPDIELELGYSLDLVRDLESEKYDLIITARNGDDDRIVYASLFEDQAVCVVSKDHPLSAQAYVHLEDFGKYDLITHTEKQTNKFYQFVLKPMGIEPKRFIIISQLQAIIEMVAAGFGITVFPRWAAWPAIESNEITSCFITKNGLPMTWRIAYLPNSQIPIFQQEFINIVRNGAMVSHPE